MRKHRISGHTTNNSHFTGPKGFGPYNACRKQQLTKKQKDMKRGTHTDKYA